MAKANPQWPGFGKGQQALVIFSQPHAYISPSLYEDKVNVPTWNYAAVHVYGTPRILPSVEERIRVLEHQFEYFDASYKVQWKTLPEDYRNRLLEGIVAFEIETTSIEGKYKLSQNKSEGDRERIIGHLVSSGEGTKTDIAELMKRTGKS